jgi:phenylacetate-coenzyme A ligase PaaK-like adenylate-forming protein
MTVELWERGAQVAQLWWAREGGVPADVLAQQRLRELVRFARERSPYYARHYRGLPRDPALHELPPAGKRDLMAHFDDWVTDRAVRREAVERFVATRAVGSRLLERYVVFQSSGASGVPGLFLQDEHALAVYDALIAWEMGKACLRASRVVPPTELRGALVAATHGHFASIVSWQEACRVYGRSDAKGFSVLEPLPRLVRALNAHAPAFLGSYPSVLAILAEERLAGRLTVAPVMLWSGGEYLAPRLRRHIEQAFGALLVNEYGASECLDIAGSCAAGNLHVHPEWVFLEPVDEQHRPVPRGQVSHTVLVTNLANRVQPIIRYDLGDRVTLLEEPCPCGSMQPALRVEGRIDDTLQLRAADGRSVALPPLALSSVMEDIARVYRYQVVQTAPDALCVRLAPGDGTRAAAWKRVQHALHAYLARHELGQVRVTLDRAAPRVERASGKLRTVIALRTTG